MTTRTSTKSAATCAVDVLVVPTLAGADGDRGVSRGKSAKPTVRIPASSLQKRFGALAERLARGEVFTGARGTVHPLEAPDGITAPRVLLVGLGPKADEEGVRWAAAAAAKAAGKAGTVAFVLEGLGLPVACSAEAAVTGFRLAEYAFDRFREKSTRQKPRQLTVLTDSRHQPAARTGCRHADAIAAGVALARDVGNLPGNHGTPRVLASEARSLARRAGLACTVLDARRMKELGMGSLLSVALGSVEPPRLIVLEHNKGRRGIPTVCVVGKGLTFDSGGISIKPAAEMDKMRHDKCGGAAVFGILSAVAALDLPLHVVGIVPSSENMPGPAANKPGDVVTAMNGKTIEILNTDAEGRLILADALCYAQRFKPSLVIDMATLTGAVLFALGKTMAGMMGTDHKAMSALSDAPRTGDAIFGVGRIIDYTPARSGAAAHLEIVGTHRARRRGGSAGVAGVAVLAERCPEPPVEPGPATELGEALLTAAADLGRLSLRRELDALVADLRAAGDPADERIMNLLATVIVGQDEVRQQLLEVDDPLIRGRHLLNIFETLFQELAGPGRPREEPS